MSARKAAEKFGEMSDCRYSSFSDGETVRFVIYVTPELAEGFELLGATMMKKPAEDARKLGATAGAAAVKMFLYLGLMDFRRLVGYALKSADYAFAEGFYHKEEDFQVTWWKRTVAEFTVKAIKRFLASDENPWKLKKKRK